MANAGEGDLGAQFGLGAYLGPRPPRTFYLRREGYLSFSAPFDSTLFIRMESASSDNRQQADLYQLEEGPPLKRELLASLGGRAGSRTTPWSDGIKILGKSRLAIHGVSYEGNVARPRPDNAVRVTIHPYSQGVLFELGFDDARPIDLHEDDAIDVKKPVSPAGLSGPDHTGDVTSENLPTNLDFDDKHVQVILSSPHSYDSVDKDTFRFLSGARI